MNWRRTRRVEGVAVADRGNAAVARPTLEIAAAVIVERGPAAARVLGAAYVSHLDDLAVFNRVLAADEVKRLHALGDGAASLKP